MSVKLNLSKQEVIEIVSGIFDDMREELSGKHYELTSSMCNLLDSRGTEPGEVNKQMDASMKELGEVSTFLLNLSRVKTVMYNRLMHELDREGECNE